VSLAAGKNNEFKAGSLEKEGRRGGGGRRRWAQREKKMGMYRERRGVRKRRQKNPRQTTKCRIGGGTPPGGQWKCAFTKRERRIRGKEGHYNNQKTGWATINKTGGKYEIKKRKSNGIETLNRRKKIRKPNESKGGRLNGTQKKKKRPSQGGTWSLENLQNIRQRERLIGDQQKKRTNGGKMGGGDGRRFKKPQSKKGGGRVQGIALGIVKEKVLGLLNEVGI